MSSRQTSQLTLYHASFLLLAGVAVAYGLKSAYDHYTAPRQLDRKSIRRRNAQRRSNRINPRHTNSTTAVETSSNAATAEALSFLDGTNAAAAGRALNSEEWELAGALNADGLTLPPDETITTMLNNAGVAARENREESNDSEFSYAPDVREGHDNQNVLQLLYLIAEDQAKQQGYVHRGVTCNLCNVIPIKGIRYRCSNCIDFDLCESCEAQDAHPKTHLFYKVRIPAPFLGNPKKIQAPVYPGKPSNMPLNIPSDLIKRLHKETGIDQPEIEALYEQFKCLAASEFPDDPNDLNGAINRQTFDKCFVPNNSLRPPPPNLIYDRMFAFYDTDSNGLIGFEEFIKGISIRSRRIAQTTANVKEKHKRVFKAYDLDGDGYIERKDVLRMFRAFYALQKDLVKDLIAGIDDDVLESNQASNIVLGSQPISAAFAGNIPMNDEPRQTKSTEDEENDVLRSALVGDGNELGRRTDTMIRALAEHRQEIADSREVRRERRERERRLIEEQRNAVERLAQENQANSISENDDNALHPQTVPDVEDTIESQEQDTHDLVETVNSSQDANTTVPPLTSGGDDEVRTALADQLQLPTYGMPPYDMEGSYPNLNFNLPDGWNSELQLEEEPGRQATDEERKLYYLDDYYRSEDEEEDAEMHEETEHSRRRMPTMSGLEKEEDVGREILCQVVEQGINQLLDYLFLSKELKGLNTMKNTSGSKSPESSSEDKENQQDTLKDSADDGESEKGNVSTSDAEPEQPVSQPTSPRLDSLNQMNTEITERGGPGRINEEEFLKLMQGDVGRKLLFMSNWINMGSF